VTVALGLALALGSAVALNWGWLEQHGRAHKLPRLTLRRPVASLRLLFGERSWVVGFSVGIGGWALYVAALALAPLSLVQGTSAGGIALLAALAHRRGHVVGRTDWWGVVAAVAGLALISASLAGGAVSAVRPQAGALAAWLAVSGAAAAVTFFSRGGIAAGLLYAAGDVATKAAVFGGIWLAVVPAVLAAHGLAFVSLQLGFQRGDALETAGAASLLTNALPIAAGLALFGEHLPGGVLGVVRVVGFVLVIGAAGMLGRRRQPQDAPRVLVTPPGPRVEKRSLVRPAGEPQQ
jgi:hypothetical protein